MDLGITFLSPPEPCHYLPDRIARMRYELAPHLEAAEYMRRLRAGWRRFGPVMFRNQCPACQQCQSLRVLVETFEPTASQRRVWRKNLGDVQVRMGPPASSPEHLALLARFHRHGHETKGWPAGGEPDARLFTDNPLPIEQWNYLLNEKLVGVGYVDVLAGGLSAIYFFHDPDERHRSLGTFNILRLLAAARERGLPHVYLGYYVKGCRSLEYKAKFGPKEILTPHGEWESLTDGSQEHAVV